MITALIVILRRKTGISLKKQDFRPDEKVMKQVLKIGIPVALQDGFIQIAFIVITVIANRRGLNDAAAVGIVEKLIGIVFLVPSTMLSAVSALSAQNIGAGKPERAVKTLKYAVMISVGFGFTVAVITQFVSVPVVKLFTDDAAVAVSGGQSCALISGTVCLQEFISVSADTSVPAEDQESHFYIIFFRLYVPVCRARIWRQYIFRIRCIQWDLRLRQDHFCQG